MLRLQPEKDVQTVKRVKRGKNAPQSLIKNTVIRSKVSQMEMVPSGKKKS